LLLVRKALDRGKRAEKTAVVHHGAHADVERHAAVLDEFSLNGFFCRLAAFKRNIGKEALHMPAEHAFPAKPCYLLRFFVEG